MQYVLRQYIYTFPWNIHNCCRFVCTEIISTSMLLVCRFEQENVCFSFARFVRLFYTFILYIAALVFSAFVLHRQRNKAITRENNSFPLFFSTYFVGMFCMLESVLGGSFLHAKKKIYEWRKYTRNSSLQWNRNRLSFPSHLSVMLNGICLLVSCAIIYWFAVEQHFVATFVAS